MAALEGVGKSVWIDTEGLGTARCSRDEIRHAIEQSDAFLFVIPPERLRRITARLRSTTPSICRNGSCRSCVAGGRRGLPEAIRVSNWIPFTAEADAAVASERLVGALDTDLVTRAHTRWLVRALEWEGHR